MAERNFSKLAERKDYLGKIFKLVEDRRPLAVMDGRPQPIAHKHSDITDIRDILWQQVQERYIDDGIDFKSPDEMLAAMLEPGRFQQLMGTGRVRDDFTNVMSGQTYPAYSNWVTGAGTPGDPGTFNTANMPILMAPFEASASHGDIVPAHA